MSDATLPPPRPSSSASAALGTTARVRSDSSSGEGDFEISFEQSSRFVARGEALGDPDGRADNKQKRKRTRYALVPQALLHTEQWPRFTALPVSQTLELFEWSWSSC